MSVATAQQRQHAREQAERDAEVRDLLREQVALLREIAQTMRGAA
jgi:hypothetical protein